jgi:hypothetical protein
MSLIPSYASPIISPYSVPELPPQKISPALKDLVDVVARHNLEHLLTKPKGYFTKRLALAAFLTDFKDLQLLITRILMRQKLFCQSI